MTKQLDADKDGKVTFSEFTVTFKKRFDKLDTNGDGAIDEAETKQVIEKIKSHHDAKPGDKKHGDTKPGDKKKDGKPKSEKKEKEEKKSDKDDKDKPASDPAKKDDEKKSEKEDV